MRTEIAVRSLIMSAMFALAVAAQPEQLAIRGHCMDSNRAPVPRARVTLYSMETRSRVVEHVRTVVADAEGRFDIEDVPRLDERESLLRSYFLVSNAPGRAIAVASLRSPDVPLQALEMILLEPGQVNGVLLDETGLPVSGADVWVSGVGVGIPAGPAGQRPPTPLPGYAWMPLIAERIENLSTVSGANGGFSIGTLPPGVPVTLTIRDPRFASKRTEEYVSFPREIHLQPAGVITGRVLYGVTREPASQVLVQAQGLARPRSTAEARTDAEGRYRLESLPASPYNLWAVADGWTGTALESFGVEARETRAAPDLVLVRGGWIAGRVIDEATGEAVRPGLTSAVRLSGPSRPLVSSAMESADVQPDGTFRIRVAPGSNQVSLRAGAEWVLVPGKHIATVVVDEGETAEVDFTVARRSPVASGRMIYQLTCVSCHDPDPNKDRFGGTFGPAVAGSSLELLRAVVLESKYPEGYRPKRDTKLMTEFPLAEAQLRDLHAYLAAQKDGPK